MISNEPGGDGLVCIACQCRGRPPCRCDPWVRKLPRRRKCWCSCLENPVVREARRAAVLGVAERKIRLSTRAHTYRADVFLCLGISGQSGRVNDEQGTHGVGC